MLIVDCKQKSLLLNKKHYKCSIGKEGYTKNKKEGDNKTPLGNFKLVELWYRADRIDKPKTFLPTKIIQKNDGWCDDSGHKFYNLHVKLPFEFSHEKLYRNDNLYDVFVVINYNYAPSEKLKGSAIFMHIAKAGYKGTEGCVALNNNDILDVVSNCSADTKIIIK